MRARIFDRVAGLVGELAEIDLVGVARARKHPDVGAGAEDARLGRAQQHHAYLRVLEAQPLERIGKLDVDAEIVGVELELVAFEQAAFLVHVHGERGDDAVDEELPVAVARRRGLEIDAAPAVRESAFVSRHGNLGVSGGMNYSSWASRLQASS